MTKTQITNNDNATLPVSGEPSHTAKDARMTWHATERTPRKRWWWWAIMIYVGVFLTALALHQQNWTFAGLTVVMTITLGYAFGSKSRTRSYTLDGTQLRIGGVVYDLTRFDRSILEDAWPDGKDTVPTTTLLLLSKARFGAPLSIFLPDDEAKAAHVQDALTQYAPLTDSSYRTTLHILDRIARWLRIG